MTTLINASKFSRFLPSVIVGLVMSLLSVTVAISFMVVIFPESLQSYLSVGIQMGLIGVIVLSLFIALKSQAYMLAKVQETFTVLLMIMVASLVGELSTPEYAPQILPTTLVLIAASSLLAGLSLFLLGHFKLGSWIRFIPYPIMIGFIAGTGWLIIVGSFKVMTDLEVKWANFPLFWQKEHAFHLLGGLVIAGLLIGIEKRYKHFLVIPFTLISLIVFFHLLFWLTPLSTHGWFLESLAQHQPKWPLLSLSDFYLVNWSVIWGQSFQFVVMIVTIAISLLLNLIGFELVVQKDLDMNQELKAAGIANLVTGFCGGLGGYQSLSFSVLGVQLQVDNRIVGFVTSFTALLLYFFGLNLISYFPRPLLGGLLFFTGFDLLVKWTYESWYKLPKIDYALAISVLVIIVGIGFLEGVSFGIFLAVILFVFQYSHIDVVKHALSGKTFRSRVDRPLEQEYFLKEQGEAIYILRLQGFLFFGTSYKIIHQIQQRLALSDTVTPRFVVIDFRLVTGMDASSLLTFSRLQQIAQKQHFQLIFTYLSKEVQKQIERIQDHNTLSLFSTLDEGLELCEQKLLSSSPPSVQNAGAASLFSLLEMPEFLLYFEKLHFAPGEYLIHQNSQSDELYFIESGQVSALLELPHKKNLRLRAMIAGTIVGELGFYLHIPRTASVIADQPTTVYKLTQEAFKKMKVQHARLAEEFQGYLICVLAERIYQANETIHTIIR